MLNLGLNRQRGIPPDLCGTAALGGNRQRRLAAGQTAGCAEKSRIHEDLPHLPEYKDFNEDLKARHGVQPLPAVPHRRKEVYFSQVQAVQLRQFSPERLRSLLQSALANGQYHTLAEYALSGSAYFLGDAGMFAKLKTKLSQQYRAYTDKGRMQAKQDNLNSAFSAVFRDFKQNARTREQCVQTAKLLYELADCAIRCEIQSSMELSAEHCEEPEIEPEQQVSQGW